MMRFSQATGPAPEVPPGLFAATKVAVEPPVAGALGDETVVSVPSEATQCRTPATT